MPRPPKVRRVGQVPTVDCFKPVGIPARELDEVVLTIEEIEAVRLKDLEGLDQQAAADEMEVSRPTFQRILQTARAKIADGLITGKALRFSGGTYQVCDGSRRGRGPGHGHGRSGSPR